MATKTTTALAKRPKRLYSPEERATALAQLDAHHGNVKATARAIGIPFSSLKRIIEAADGDTERDVRVRSLRAEKRSQLADVFDDITWNAARQVLDRIGDASARDAAVVMGISTEKALLLRGQPTVIHGDNRLAALSPDQRRALRAILAGEVQVVESAPCLPVADCAEGSVIQSPQVVE